jgi:hypothetical protein
VNLAENTLFPHVGLTAHAVSFFKAELKMKILARSRKAEQALWGRAHTKLILRGGKQETLNESLWGRGENAQRRKEVVGQGHGTNDLTISLATNLSSLEESCLLTSRQKGCLYTEFFMPPV